MKRKFEKANTININFQDKDKENGNDKLSKVDKIIDTVKNIVKEALNAPWIKVFKLFIIVLILVSAIVTCLFAYSFINGNKATNQIVEYVTRKPTAAEESYGMGARSDINTNMSFELNKMIYTLGASRAFVLEFHNGKENAASLPFVYLDMSYEEQNENHKELEYISSYYQNVPISHYNFATIVAKKYIYIGDVESIREYDPRLTQVMEKNNVNYFGCILLKSRGHKIGFLCVTYEKGNKHNVNKREIEYNLKEAAKIISPLLDLSCYKKNKPNKNILLNNENI